MDAIPRALRPPRRDPTPPAPDAPGGYLALEQPNLFWRAWDVLQGDVRLAHVTRGGWRRWRVETADGAVEARFEPGRLLLGALVAQPAPGGARVGGAAALPQRRATLAYRSEEAPYPTLADEAGPLALFGDMRGAGFSARADVWAADRLLARGQDAVLTLAMCVLVLRERPGSFR